MDRTNEPIRGTAEPIYGSLRTAVAALWPANEGGLLERRHSWIRLLRAPCH